MRKVFLEDLPRWESGRYKGSISWKDCIGISVEFVYEELKGYIEIIDYKSDIIKAKYKDNIKNISTYNFRKCQISNILNLRSFDYVYDIGDIVTGKSSNIKILERRKYTREERIYRTYKYECLNCGNIDTIMELNLTRDNGCNVCSGSPKKVLIGYNDLWTTNPEAAKMLKFPEIGYTISYGNATKQIFICPDCGLERNIRVNDVSTNGFKCPQCGDGGSFPEKLMFSMLNQLDIIFENEKVFDWAPNKRYDFYIPSLNCVIETNGLQHYEDRSKNSVYHKTLKEEQENDRLKEQLAYQNGIQHYVFIDCRKSDLEFIKDNILNSEINNLFDLSNIDWLICHRYAAKNIVKEVGDLYNLGIANTSEIGGILKIDRHTVQQFLLEAKILGYATIKQ